MSEMTDDDYKKAMDKARFAKWYTWFFDEYQTECIETQKMFEAFMAGSVMGGLEALGELNEGMF